MKLIFFNKIITLVLLINLSAQETLWKIQWKHPQSFIRNDGQFDKCNKLLESQILYGIDHGNVRIFFTKEGFTIRIDNWYRNPHRVKGDTTKPKYLIDTKLYHMKWLNANDDVSIEVEHETPDYHTYSMVTKNRTYYDIPFIPSYKYLWYKNIYSGIDIKFEVHPIAGFKYSIYAQPHADISAIKMHWSGDAIPILDNEKIIIHTPYDNIIDHPPISYYAKNLIPIKTKFHLSNNIVSFILENYDSRQAIVIDPWIVTPTLPNSNCVWECETDNTGNVYIIGGDMPMKLQKYNPTGTLLWTYNTPWDTANNWLGTLATDANGVSYITSGSVAAMQKISTNGTLIWGVNGGPMDEYWIITFNCDQTKLVVGGTRLILNAFGQVTGSGVIFDINPNNGNVMNITTVATIRPNIMVNDPNEVRAFSSSRNARYYYLTLDSIGSINQNMTLCNNNPPIFNILSGYNFGYKCENFRPNNGNAGIMAIRANNQFVYVNNGTTLHRRDLNTGAILGSATIPGGENYPQMGLNRPGNSGVITDDCGNVYAGSANRIMKYDAMLNVLSQHPTSYKVFDIAVAPNGNIIACGGTGTSASTTRTGYIERVDMSACAPFQLICCLTNICPAGPFCHNDPPYQLIVEQAGGTFSGPGVNPTTGLFNPAAAGPGTHTITYTLPCGSSSIQIVVNYCDNLEVCREPNNNLTVSGGMGPYTWQYWQPAYQTPITNQQQCQACGYTWVPFVNQCLDGVVPVTVCNHPAQWVTYHTGTTAPPPPQYPLQVIDSQNNNVVYNNASQIPDCAPCPPITIQISNLSHVTCHGGSNGSFTATVTGGNAPYSYVLTIGGNQVISYNNVGNQQLFSNLSAGTYTLQVTDAQSCTQTIQITIQQPPQLSVSVSNITNATCNASNGSITVSASGGTPGYTYVWNTTPQQTGSTATNLSAGTYSVTVTDNNGCTATTQAIVNNINAPNISLVNIQHAACGNSNGSITISVSGGTQPYTFQWNSNPPQNTQNLTGVPAGTYTITVTDANTCIAIQSFTINNIPGPSITTSVTNATCGNSDGSATVTPSGGTPPYTYLWSSTPQQTSSTMTNVPAGVYTVTVTDANNCTATAMVSITNIGGPQLTFTTTPAICGQANGSATVYASGGTGNYTYTWYTTPQQNTQTAYNLAPGTYSVEVDDGQCPSYGTVQIPDSIIPINISFTNVIPSSCSQPNGMATALPTSGTAPFSYQWNSNPPQFTQTLQNVTGGNYTVTITDFNGCTGSAIITIPSEDNLYVQISTTPDNCGQCNGTATVIVPGATGTETFLWSNNATTNVVTNLCTGNYYVTVSRDNCQTITQVTIPGSSGPIAAFIAIPQVSIIGQGPITFQDISIGNITSWYWSFGDGTTSTEGPQVIHNYLTPGQYTVLLVVTDINGCSDTAQVTVHIKDDVNFYIPNTFSPNNDGINDYFTPIGYNVDPDGFEMFIFNRWGQIMYYTNEWDVNTVKKPWNGTLNNSGTHKDAIPGVYVYKIYVKDMFGYLKEHKGVVLISK